MDCHRSEKTKTAKISKLKFPKKKPSIKNRNSIVNSNKGRSMRESLNFGESTTLTSQAELKTNKKSAIYKTMKPKLSFTRKTSTKKQKSPSKTKSNKNEIRIDKKLDNDYTFMNPSADPSAFYKKLRLDTNAFRPSCSPRSQATPCTIRSSPEHFLIPETKSYNQFSVFENFSQVSADLSRHNKLSLRINYTPTSMSTAESYFSSNYT